jgi:hypothetical protein
MCGCRGPFRATEAPVEIASGDGWSVTVYRTADGFGVSYARASGGSSFATGTFPFSEGRASRYIVVALGAPDPASDGRGMFCGLVAASVARVEVEVRDGSVVSAETLPLPNVLATDLRAFLLRPRPDGRPLSLSDPPTRAFSCLAADGSVLERHVLHRRNAPD